ncbi:hypothetical protein [Weissella hellenica]
MSNEGRQRTQTGTSIRIPIVSQSTSDDKALLTGDLPFFDLT